MYYIIESMPINSRQRAAYFTNLKGERWLSPLVCDAFKYTTETAALRDMEKLKKESSEKRTHKTFRVIKMVAPRVYCRNR